MKIPRNFYGHLSTLEVAVLDYINDEGPLVTYVEILDELADEFGENEVVGALVKLTALKFVKIYCDCVELHKSNIRSTHKRLAIKETRKRRVKNKKSNLWIGEVA